MRSSLIDWSFDHQNVTWSLCTWLPIHFDSEEENYNEDHYFVLTTREYFFHISFFCDSSKFPSLTKFLKNKYYMHDFPCAIMYSTCTQFPKPCIRAEILYQSQKKHTFIIIIFQKTVLDPIGKLELIFDWELAVKRPIKMLHYTLLLPKTFYGTESWKWLMSVYGVSFFENNLFSSLNLDTVVWSNTKVQYFKNLFRLINIELKTYRLFLFYFLSQIVNMSFKCIIPS